MVDVRPERDVVAWIRQYHVVDRVVGELDTKAAGDEKGNGGSVVSSDPLGACLPCPVDTPFDLDRVGSENRSRRLVNEVTDQPSTIVRTVDRRVASLVAYCCHS